MGDSMTDFFLGATFRESSNMVNPLAFKAESLSITSSCEMALKTNPNKKVKMNMCRSFVKRFNLRLKNNLKICSDVIK